MKIAYLISVYLHIIAACLWIGGTLFLILVAIPSVQNLPNKLDLIETIGLKFRFYGWIALSTLLLTGLYNLSFRGMESYEYFHTEQGFIPGVKFCLFIVIATTAGIHDFRIGNKAIQALKENPEAAKSNKLVMTARWMGRINFLFSLIMVGIGVVIVRGWF